VTSTLRGRSFLKELDFTGAELLSLVELARDLKAEKREGREQKRLTGRSLALIFEKTSTRTRCAFEVAAADQGAFTTYLGPDGSQLGHKESVKDTARVLGRMYDGIEFRGFSQDAVETLAEFSGVPVWNGLTDAWHPTQVLADALTMTEHSTKPLAQITHCYIGDARNNVGNSALVAGALFGMDIRVCAPRELWPEESVIAAACSAAAVSGARVTLTEDVGDGVRGADFVSTDIWVSMGEPVDVWQQRVELLRGYQVNAGVLAATGNPGVRFMHCLPAYHDLSTGIGRFVHDQFGLDGVEVTDEVFEGPASIVFDQAENRLHTIKAVLVATLAD
jgi:ornithine carbamoyltransferase